MKLQFVLFAILFAGLRAENEVALGQYPWHAYLWMTNTVVDSTYTYCDGGLISTSWVITAAHCIHDVVWMYVRVGGVGVMEGFEDYSYVDGGQYKFVPANFDMARRYMNDVGLVYMYDPISLSPNIALIPLPTPGDTNLDHLRATLTGFGLSIDNPFFVLRYMNFPVMPESWCLTRHNFADPSTLCTDTIDAGHLPCLENHGGPLTALVGGRQVLIGVGSDIDEPCGAGHHGVFTRITAHLTWINSIMANPPAPPAPTPEPRFFESHK